jgi:hypothetical protein
MTYTIKQFNPYTGQLIVEFDPAVGTFSVDVPLTQDGLYITGDDLTQYIAGFEPRDFIDRRQKIDAGIANSAEIAAIAESVYEAPAEVDIEAAQAAEEAQKAAALDKYIKAALIKYNLIVE